MQVRSPGGRGGLRDACLCAYTVCKCTHTHTQVDNAHIVYTCTHSICSAHILCSTHMHAHMGTQHTYSTPAHTCAMCGMCAVKSTHMYTGYMHSAHRVCIRTNVCAHQTVHTCTHMGPCVCIVCVCTHCMCHAPHTACTHMHMCVVYTPHTCAYVGMPMCTHTHMRIDAHTPLFSDSGSKEVSSPAGTRVQQNRVSQRPAFGEQPRLTLFLHPVGRPHRRHRLNCSLEPNAALASSVPSTRERLGNAPRAPGAGPEGRARALRVRRTACQEPAATPLMDLSNTLFHAFCF